MWKCFDSRMGESPLKLLKWSLFMSIVVSYFALVVAVDGGDAAVLIQTKLIVQNGSKSIPVGNDSLMSFAASLIGAADSGSGKKSGSGGKNSTSGRKSQTPQCNTTELDSCSNGLEDVLAKLSHPKIPSTEQEIDGNCRVYANYTNCMEIWAKKCLGDLLLKKYQNSIQGAEDAFAFLCRDPVFRKEYLFHATCARKISRNYDGCSEHFINGLRKLGPNPKPVRICCQRLLFLECISEVAHLHCNIRAAEFFYRMGELLVQNTLKGHYPPECDSVIYYMNCTVPSSAAPSSRAQFSPSKSLISFGNSFMNLIEFAMRDLWSVNFQTKRILTIVGCVFFYSF